MSKYDPNYYRLHKEAYKAANYKWRRAHPEHYNAIQKRYRFRREMRANGTDAGGGVQTR